MAFESRQVSEKMVWAWVQHHTVFKRSHKSTMIHWQTWDFQHSDSDQAQFFSSALACSHGSQSKTLKGGALPSYWSMFTPCYLSPVHLPVISDKIHLILRTEPQALHGDPAFLHARHDKACPCDNSMHTLLLQMVIVTLTDQSLFWDWLYHKDFREGLQGFFFFLKSWRLKLSEKHHLRHRSLGMCGSNRVQKRNCIDMNLIARSNVSHCGSVLPL